MKRKISFVNGVLEATSRATGKRMFSRFLRDREAQPIDLVWFQETCVAYEKNTPHLERGKGMSLFNSDLIYDSDLQLYRKVRNSPRDFHRSGTLEMFLASLLSDSICLRIDVLKISYCVNTLFIIWFLYVFYQITFVLGRRNVNEFFHLLISN